MSLGSLYGGLCLGPVNTGAVHALAYPIGGTFHVPHGLSNALVLPHVLRFNAPDAAHLYAEIAADAFPHLAGEEGAQGRCAAFIVRSAEKPSLRFASCCSVEVVKGGEGLRLRCFLSTFATVSAPAA